MLQQYNTKNENIQVFVGGKLYHRNEAKISVFDSAVQGGDAVWEGLRVYNGKIFSFNEHMNVCRHRPKYLRLQIFLQGNILKLPLCKHLWQMICIRIRISGLPLPVEKKLHRVWILG